MPSTNALIPIFERELRDFLKPRGVDVDSQAVMFQLYRTSTDAIAAMEAAELRALGLSHAAFVLLMTLWISGPHEVGALVRAHRARASAAARVVARLERDAFVRRVRSTAGPRSVTVQLTARGHTVVEKAQAALHRCEKALTAELTVTEKRQLADLLRRVGHAARAHLRKHAA